MTQTSLFTEPSMMVRWYNERRGAWYHVRLLSVGRKWAVVEEYGTGKHHRVALDAIQEAL